MRNYHLQSQVMQIRCFFQFAMLAAFILLAHNSAEAEIQKDFSIEEQGAWGFINKNGVFKIAKRLNSSGQFKDGFASVCYGKEPTNYQIIIDKQGQTLGGMLFAKAGQMQEGFSVVAYPVRTLSTTARLTTERSGSGQTYVSKAGTLFSDSFVECGEFSSGVAIVRAANQVSYALLNKAGGVIKTIRGTPLSLKFEEGLTPVLVQNSVQYIYATGLTAFKTKFHFGSGFHEGLAAVAIEENNGLLTWGFINKKGNLVVPCIYQRVENFHEDLARVYSRSPGFSGFIDPSGKPVLSFEKDKTYSDFYEGLASVVDSRGTKMVDRQGRVVINMPNCAAGNFHEGLCSASNKDGKWGFIDKSGKWIISPIFSKADDFYEGLAAVCIRDEAKINRERLIYSPNKEFPGAEGKLF